MMPRQMMILHGPDRVGDRWWVGFEPEGGSIWADEGYFCEALDRLTMRDLEDLFELDGELIEVCW